MLGWHEVHHTDESVTIYDDDCQPKPPIDKLEYYAYSLKVSYGGSVRPWTTRFGFLSLSVIDGAGTHHDLFARRLEVAYQGYLDSQISPDHQLLIKTGMVTPLPPTQHHQRWSQRKSKIVG